MRLANERFFIIRAKYKKRDEERQEDSERLSSNHLMYVLSSQFSLDELVVKYMPSLSTID